MKSLYAIVLIIIAAFAGCSGGFVYTNHPALEFADIDYGFAVKSAATSPRIAYIDEGSGKQTLLLVHGLASNAGFWRYAIPALSKHFRVIAVDLPGYGKSGKGAYAYNMSFYAESIHKLLQELRIEKVVYAGHSMGGQIGIHFALKYPQHVEKLILCSPAGLEKFERGEGDWLKNVLTVAAVSQTNEEGIRRNLANNFYTWDDRYEWMVEERCRMAKATEFNDFAYAVVRSVHGMIDEPTSDKLEMITVPTYIIYGEYDGLIPNPYLNPGFPADVFKEGAARIQRCRIYEIKNCGHMLQIERPEEFSNALIEFATAQ